MGKLIVIEGTDGSGKSTRRHWVHDSELCINEDCHEALCRHVAACLEE